MRMIEPPMISVDIFTVKAARSSSHEDGKALVSAHEAGN
jgi:hypothetical protein